MDGSHKPTAVALLSGGIDSAVATAMCRDDFNLIALTVEYGQPVAEKLAAIAIADWLQIKSKPLVRIPSFNAIKEPSHYFPMRNLILLAHAAQIAEVNDAHWMIVGCNADDYADYWDCRPEFFERMNEALILNDITIRHPVLHLTKAQVVAEALRLGVPLELTMSCYRPQDRTPCGECNACLLRRRAYEANGLDPTPQRLVVDFGEAKPKISER